MTKTPILIVTGVGHFNVISRSRARQKGGEVQTGGPNRGAAWLDRLLGNMAWSLNRVR